MPARGNRESSDEDEERSNKYDKAGKLRKMKHEQTASSESLGSNIRTLVSKLQIRHVVQHTLQKRPEQTLTIVCGETTLLLLFDAFTPYSMV